MPLLILSRAFRTCAAHGIWSLQLHRNYYYCHASRLAQPLYRLLEQYSYLWSTIQGIRTGDTTVHRIYYIKKLPSNFHLNISPRTHICSSTCSSNLSRISGASSHSSSVLTFAFASSTSRSCRALAAFFMNRRLSVFEDICPGFFCIASSKPHGWKLWASVVSNATV